MKQQQVERYLKRVMPKVLPGWTWEVEFTDVPLRDGNSELAAEVDEPLSQHVTFRINKRARFDGEFFNGTDSFVRVPMSRLIMHEISHVIIKEHLGHIYLEIESLAPYIPPQQKEQVNWRCDHFEEDLVDHLAEVFASLAEAEE